MTIDNQGSALVGALIGATILGVMAAAFGTMMETSQRNVKHLEQKLEALDLQGVVTGALADSNACGCNFDRTKNTADSNRLNFNPSTMAPITLPQLYTACNAGGTAPEPNSVIAIAGEPLPGSTSGLNVSTITLGNIRPISSGRYWGEVLIGFDPMATGIARRPAKATITFGIDGSNNINDCSVQGSTVGGGGGSGFEGVSLGTYTADIEGTRNVDVAFSSLADRPNFVSGRACCKNSNTSGGVRTQIDFLNGTTVVHTYTPCSSGAEKGGCNGLFLPIPSNATGIHLSAGGSSLSSDDDSKVTITLMK